MALTGAKVVRFEKNRSPAPESLVTSVFVAVSISDDAAPITQAEVVGILPDPDTGLGGVAPQPELRETKYAEFFCQGDELVAMQALDAAGKKQAAKTWLRGKAAETHAAWVAEMAAPKATRETYDSDMLLAEFGATTV